MTSRMVPMPGFLSWGGVVERGVLLSPRGPVQSGPTSSDSLGIDVSFAISLKSPKLFSPVRLSRSRDSSCFRSLVRSAKELRLPSSPSRLFIGKPSRANSLAACSDNEGGLAGFWRTEIAHSLSAFVLSGSGSSVRIPIAISVIAAVVCWVVRWLFQTSSIEPTATGTAALRTMSHLSQTSFGSAIQLSSKKSRERVT